MASEELKSGGEAGYHPVTCTKVKAHLCLGLAQGGRRVHHGGPEKTSLRKGQLLRAAEVNQDGHNAREVFGAGRGPHSNPRVCRCNGA